MDADTIQCELESGVARVTVVRPEQMNAMTPEMVDALLATIERIECEPAARVVLIAGAGPHFMAGGDVAGFGATLALTAEERARHFRRILDASNALIAALRRMPQPVIIAARGAVAGFGLSLVLAADVALASETAFLVPAYLRLGATPDSGASYFLPRTVGHKRAAEILLTGERVDAATAAQLGVVSRVVADDVLDAEALALATRIAAGPQAAISGTKRLLDAARTTELQAQLDAEAEAFVGLCSTPDFIEGVASFLAKRKPKFGNGRG